MCIARKCKSCRMRCTVVGKTTMLTFPLQSRHPNKQQRVSHLDRRGTNHRLALKKVSALVLTLGWLWPSAAVTTEASPFHRVYCELRARLFQMCSRWQGRIKHLASWSRNKSWMMDDCNIRHVQVALRQSRKERKTTRRWWGEDEGEAGCLGSLPG